MTLFCMKCDKWLILLSLLSFDAMDLYDIAEKFNESQTTLYIACYQTESDMEEFGYNITLLDKVQTVMKGSHRRHTCYIYKRNDVKERCNEGEPKCDALFHQGLDVCNSTDPHALQGYLEIEKTKLFETSQRERKKINYKV
jgi:hypothetical protein